MVTQILYILLYIFYTGLFTWLIFKWRFFEIPDTNKKLLAGFFLLKVVAGFGLTLIYTYYYTDQSKADIYRYFTDSKIISQILFTDPIAWLKIMTGIGIADQSVFNYLLTTLHFSHPAGDLVTSNAFLIKVISLLNYFSFSNIYIDTLFFNFITFIGFTALYKSLRIYFASFQAVLFVPIYLLPSVIFWCSGLLKESIMYVGISFYIYAWLKGNEKRTTSNTLLLIAGLAIVALIKIYVAVLLVLCSLFLPLSSFTKLPYPLTRRIIIYACAAFVGWYYFGNNFCEKIIYKRDEFILLGLSENAGSSLDTKLLEPTCGSFLAVLPKSITSAMLGPFVWQQATMFQLFFAIENLLLLSTLTLTLLLFFKKPEGPKLWLCIFSLGFAVLNYVVIGVTVPVMGAIVHYRVVAIPFLVIGIMLMLDVDKLKKRVAILL